MPGEDGYLLTTLEVCFTHLYHQAKNLQSVLRVAGGSNGLAQVDVFAAVKQARLPLPKRLADPFGGTPTAEDPFALPADGSGHGGSSGSSGSGSGNGALPALPAVAADPFGLQSVFSPTKPPRAKRSSVTRTGATESPGVVSAASAARGLAFAPSLSQANDVAGPDGGNAAAAPDARDARGVSWSLPQPSDADGLVSDTEAVTPALTLASAAASDDVGPMLASTLGLALPVACAGPSHPTPGHARRKSAMVVQASRSVVSKDESPLF